MYGNMSNDYKEEDKCTQCKIEMKMGNFPWKKEVETGAKT